MYIKPYIDMFKQLWIKRIRIGVRILKTFVYRCMHICEHILKWIMRRYMHI